MTETLACHHILNIIDEIICIEGDQLLSLHEIADRHTLVDETCRCIGVIRCGDDRTSSFLCQLLDGHGHPCPFAHNDAGSPHLDGAQLGLVPVSQDHQVMLFNIILHQIRICGGDQDLSLIKICLRVSHHNAALQGIQDVGILGIGLGNDTAVIQVHIGFGNISDGDDAL